MAAGYTVEEVTDPRRVKSVRRAAQASGTIRQPGVLNSVANGAQDIRQWATGAKNTAKSAAQTAYDATRRAVAAAPQQAVEASRGLVSAAPRATGFVRNLVSAPAAAITAVGGGVADSLGTSQKDYQTRIGSGSGVFDRLVGTATDIGNRAINGVVNTAGVVNKALHDYTPLGTLEDLVYDRDTQANVAAGRVAMRDYDYGKNNFADMQQKEAARVAAEQAAAATVAAKLAAAKPAAAKPAPAPTLTGGESARFGVPTIPASALPPEQSYNPETSLRNFTAGKTETGAPAIRAKLGPVGPEDWSVKHADAFGAPATTQMAQKTYGNDTVTMLKDKDGKVTFTNAKSFADMANTPMGVSNVTNADGTKYDAAAHQAKIAAAEADLNAAKAADLDANRAGLRQKPQDLRSVLAEKANSPLIAVSQNARQQLAQMDTAAANNIAEDQRADKRYMRDVALKGMEIDAKNPANVLATQKAQLEAERNGRNDRRADAAAFDTRRKTALDQVANAYALTSTDKNGNQTQHPNMQLAADIESSFANMPEAVKAQMKQKHGKELAFHEMSANEQRRFAAASQLRRQLAADSDTLGVSVDSLPTAWDLYSNPAQVQQTQRGTYKVGANNKVDSTPFLPWAGQSTADVERKYGKLTREIQGQF